MPRFLKPKNSIQHRVAAIALYRALLTRCSSVPLCEDDRTSLRNAIRNKFRKNRKVEGPYSLGLSFKAGYEALDCLDESATGNAAKVGLVRQMIARVPLALKRTPWVRPPPLPKAPKERLECLPPERAVLNVRPHATISGPRRVPVLASANGIPFLRLSKPQPPALSRILRQRLQRKIHMFSEKVLLANWWLPLCRQEDEWDRLLDVQLKRLGDAEKWTDAIRIATRDNDEAHQRDLAKDRETMKKMQKIVDMETKLALKEGQTIVRGRRRRPIRVIRP